MDEVLHNRRDMVMGALAGQAALAAQAAAQTLYEAGGHGILGATAQAGLQKTLTGAAAGVVATAAPVLLVEGSREAAALIGPRLVLGLTGDAARASAATTVRAAGAQVLRTTARAGAIGLVVDAAFGAAEGLAARRRGVMTGKQACVHAAIEAGTGAVSTSVGVLLAAGAVALTGGLAAPAVLAIGTGGALAAKFGLRRLIGKPRPTPAPADTRAPAPGELAVPTDVSPESAAT